MNPGFYGYTSAALGFAFLAILMLFSWRGSLQGRLLTIAVIASVVWAVAAAVFSVNAGDIAAIGYVTAEDLRYLAWFVFLFSLFRQLAGRSLPGRAGLPLCVVLALLTLLAEVVAMTVATPAMAQTLMTLQLAGHVVLAMAGLAIIEQLFRNIADGFRSSMRYLFIGAGVIFAYDFYLYANALLFIGVDHDLWGARGFVNLFTVPLLTIAAARNKDWSPNIFVSRDIVLHTTTIAGGGLYLVIMAVTGYYLREIGGDWGRVVQVAFLSLSIIFLVMVLFSGKIRKQLRVFLGKHFYRNKYDYRHEWLRLTSALSNRVKDPAGYPDVVSTLAGMVDARAGQLWLADEHGKYRNVAAWCCDVNETSVSGADPLVRFMADRFYVVNLREIDARPDEYGSLEIPGWATRLQQAWLLVPLAGLDRLVGFIVLAQPRMLRDLNWEDRDLLKTAARQLASHLAVLSATDALAQARQFEVFNRLSSYMVHDLKNIAAGLEMIAVNAGRHRDKPEFLDDAFDSVATASRDIRRLLQQLRNRRVGEEKRVLVDVRELLDTAAARLSGGKPVPEVQPGQDGCQVVADRQRLENVLVHLIENAQQATAAEGYVRIALHSDACSCKVEIVDNGHGMEKEFIRDRLFRPFDTTKGNAGMGIGVYESREFMRSFGGDIHVQSRPGEGTRIELEFPACSD